MNTLISVSNPGVLPASRRIWLLRLVPAVRFGRWWCALLMFTLLLSVFWSAGALSAAVDDSPSWPGALFFCVILSYITPVFHYITQRTEEAFDDLLPALSLDDECVAGLRASISRKSRRWIVSSTLWGILLWVVQSYFLAGGFQGMYRSITEDPTSSVMSIGALPVWVFTSCALIALVDNARLFRRLKNAVDIDILDTRALNPFGRMAVSSTLMVIGTQASFPIMWLGANTDPWTTMPGVVVTTVVLVYLFIAPVWPVHRALRQAKQAELARVQMDINARRGHSNDHGGYDALAPLLSYRRDVQGTPEWPFDLSIVARLGLYLVIVPLTWIGAALIENLVDLFLE